MALSFTAAATNAASSGTADITTVTATLPVAVAAGDIVLVAGSGGGAVGVPSTLTFSDGGDAYTDSGLGLISDSSFPAGFRIGAFLTPTVGTTNFTITMTPTNHAIDIYAWKVSGFTGTPTLDKKAQAAGNSASADSGSSGTLTAAAEAAVCYVGWSNTASAAGSGWSTGGTNINDGINANGDIGEHQITSSTTAINGTASGVSSFWLSMLLTVYDAGAAATPVLFETNNTIMRQRVRATAGTPT